MASRLYFVISVIYFFTLFPASGETSTKPLVALVIGNSKYESSIGPLRNPANDAKEIAKTLRILGFSVIEERNVSRDGLLESVADFRKKISGSEVALFYFAGHGISVSGSNYLIPIKSGYQPDSADGTALRMLAETKLFNVDQVVAEMNAAGGKCNLVILDACRNTPIARNSNVRGTTPSGGLTEMKPPAGSLIAFATDAGYTAQDGDGSNGLYTSELLKHLVCPGLTIEQVFKRTRTGVIARSNGSQIPAEYSRLYGDDIYLAGTSKDDTAATRESIPKAAPVTAPSSAAINKLAASGLVKECINALRLRVSTVGAGDYAAAPLDAILEKIKEDIKELSESSPGIAVTMAQCELALAAIQDCIPPTHPQIAILTSKAHNRRGDCLLLLGRAEDALSAFNSASALSPDDSYPIYNRGRARLALGHKNEAKSDFTTASDTKFKQPTARKLALKALADFNS